MNSIAKIAAVALLAMVPSAFGAVNLMLNDGGGSDSRNTPVASGATLVLTVDMGITGAEGVAGYTYFLESSVPGAFRITGRTNNSAVITDVTSSNAVVVNAAFNSLNPKNGVDLGATAPVTGIPELDALYTPGENDIMTITLTANMDVDAAVITVSSASWNTTDGTQLVFNQQGSYTITPEPVSALLLVLGGLFVTRRRAA
jgi:hypothetical protein